MDKKIIKDVGESVKKPLLDILDKTGAKEITYDVTKLMKTSNVLKTVPKVGGILFAAGTGLHYIMRAQDSVRAAAQTQKQSMDQWNKERQLNKKDGQKEAYMDPREFDMMLQNLYSGRKGSSNTWGGKRY